MKNSSVAILALSGLSVLSSCEILDDFIGADSDQNQGKIEKLRFIDEYVIPDGQMFQNTLVGGLSGIDYADGKWYLISDDAMAPIRFYTAAIVYDENGFEQVAIQSVVELKDISGDAFGEGTVDPESIRVKSNGDIIWTSEGNVNGGVDPFVRFASADGTYRSEVLLDDKFKVSAAGDRGPRHNGAFEGVSLARNGNGYWTSMELPLVQDGDAPTLEDTESPVRIVNIHENGVSGKEFVYELDAVVRQSEDGAFIINGIVEILEYDEYKFLVLERSFSAGFADGGNNVKVYDVDVSNATDVRGMKTLKGATYQKVTKRLLFDFESVRDQLTDGVVDNIEGIAFGPELENGNRSLVLVADNNFSAFGPQLNQFILLEVQD